MNKPSPEVQQPAEPTQQKTVRSTVIEILATGLYIGKIPFMPGTWGTLWGLPLAWLLYQTGPYLYMIGCLVFLLIAVVVAEMYETLFHKHDAKEIIIDEILGYAIAMTWVPMNARALFGAFVLFRIFDIFKPFPIGYIDRNVKGGLGTVLDDAAAGIVANILLQIIYTQTNWLGVQLHVS